MKIHTNMPKAIIYVDKSKPAQNFNIGKVLK
jgi:hypothetical protein